MPKVFALWRMTIRPGQEEEFERFVRQMDASPSRSGTRLRICKGERGEGLGKYLMLNEFESVEARDRYFPAPGVQSKEGEEVMQSETVRKFLSFVEEQVNSDWVELFEQQPAGE